MSPRVEFLFACGSTPTGRFWVARCSWLEQRLALSSSAQPAGWRPPSRAARRTRGRPYRLREPSGLSVGVQKPVSTSSTSTACPANGITPSTWGRASRSSTTTTTTTSTSSFHKGRCSGPGESSVRPSSRPRVRCHSRVGYFGTILALHADGTRVIRFTDVTDKSGINADRYGMGVATGDFDNDGCVDSYVTALGRNQLFRNNCDGTFTDVSTASRTDDSGWSSSAAFVDYDRDGWLDLFVAHYLNYSTGSNVRCFSANGMLDYCPPHVYPAQPSHLFHNNRDGTFTDVTASAGLSRRVRPRPRSRDRRFQRRRVGRPLRGQ